jgi:2-polyprenyl-6-methoxyphenol hydroxylase-like FAD-dependent oxidoreductase
MEGEMASGSRGYDVIVLGARCAGSPTAMLLARQGHRVLLVDRASFPSDTVSTHILHPRAVAALARWGLLERLAATGCPAIHTYSFDFGAAEVAGSPGTPESPVAYCARRTILDKLLLDAAAEAGAEVREGFTVERLLVEDGRVCGVVGQSRDGGPVTERAALVIGADGRNSLVAEAVGAERYDENTPLVAFHYSYWGGLPMAGRLELYDRPSRLMGAFPTHDDQTLVVVGWPAAEHRANRTDVEGAFLRSVDLAPEFAARLSSAERQAPFAGAITPNFFRKPFGPGWALVGDAGYIRDPITAQGISDSFRDAELCAAAAHEALGGGDADQAMARYQAARDRSAAPMYAYTLQLAAMQPPPPEMQQLIGALQGNRQGMDGFVQMYAGTISPDEFLAPKNLEALMAAAG